MRFLCTSIVAAFAIAAAAAAETHTVLANSTSFSPDAIEVAPGDTIVWKYNSGYPHTVTSGMSCTADDLFYGELQGSGDTFTWEVPLNASGDIHYFCEPHCFMGMDGVITVVGGPPITGACCYEDEALGLICADITQDECEGLPGGHWYGDGVTCTAPQVECDLPGGDAGACCYQWNCESHCGVMSQADCAAYWGSTFFPNANCENVSCPPASDKSGACCYGDDSGVLMCDEMEVWGCENLGGMWYPGIPCECIECESAEPEGACCYDDPSLGWICAEVVLAQCEDLPSSVWYGAGVPCTAPQVECDLPGGGGCVPSPAYECAGPPNYADPDYAQVFGSGQIAVETASPNILGDKVVMVFDLSDVDAAPLNSWFPVNRYSHSDWRSSTLGSIFGLAVDGDGNIYVTATKSWNTDSAGFGGWGAIYKLDNVTGQPTVFATLPNSGASLGNITWDCVHQMFYVSNMEDGRIYRLDANGNTLNWFDHGTPWNGQPGPVALGDRPWAVEAHGGRLYYSMWNENNNGTSSLKNEIWSVQLDGMGDFTGVEQLEVTVPDFTSNHTWSSPVSDIRFSPEGTMFMAERSMISFTAINAHYARVLEYVCENGDWVPSAYSYDVGGSTGFTGGIAGTNASGGVDVDPDRIWASGDALALNAPPPYSNIYGFTGIPTGGGTVSDSLIIDYQDNTSDQDKTMLGDLVVTSPGSDCPGDLDGDGAINIDDLLIVIGGWGGTDGDVDGDGITNIEDLLVLLAGFGPCT